MSRIFVTRPLPEEILAPLIDWDLIVSTEDEPVSRKALNNEIRAAEGLLSMLTDPLDAEMIASAPSLRVISQMAVGVDNIDISACRQRGIVVGHTPGVLTQTVADTAFALLGAVVRRLPEGAREVADGRWAPWSPFHLSGGDLWGTTLGVIGMGRIGRAVASRGAAFGMKVVYFSPNSRVPEFEAMALEELLDFADHVIICAELNEGSHALIGREELRRMKPTSYLVNVSRGQLVDTQSLVEALREGEIAGAGLDVTDPEPLPADHPLLGFPNCLVTPHIASASIATRTAMANLAVRNLVAGMRGEPLPGVFTGAV